MKNLFDRATADQLKQRLDVLRGDATRQWGSMSAAQALAHCASALEMAMGEIRPARAVIGRLIGALIKPSLLGSDEGFRRNSATLRELRVRGEYDLDAERVRLRALIDRFVSGGPSACTSHPHPLFGSLSPAEWAVLMYKHLDHHLRQFGV